MIDKPIMCTKVNLVMLLSAALLALPRQQIFFSIENSFEDIKSIMKNFSLWRRCETGFASENNSLLLEESHEMNILEGL
jgi:hypothetical protein